MRRCGCQRIAGVDCISAAVARRTSIDARRPAGRGGRHVLSGGARPPRRRRARLSRRTSPAAAGAPPKALIVPHAGYVYSGPIAAAAYARLAPLREHGRRASCCWARRIACAVRGLAVPRARVRSPRRSARCRSTATPSRGRSRCRRSWRATPRMRTEHALEVQLPFLQTVLGEFSLVPFAVGRATPDEVAEVLDAAVGRSGDADRRQLGPVALSPVRRGAPHRPRHRGRDPRAVARRSITSRRAAPRRSTASCVRASAAASRPRCSTCATPATPRATARASSATRRSPSPIMTPRH